ncbi:MAG: FAD-binding protein [Saccharolobus sp.]|uniref:Redox protein n=1 Tax=Saccharolobus shibatae (strain ATCC 51178 / DSM 5389 / JCM 8931 / NBRC 15437 / B12) TaxID=523848 RepID=A0A8F5BP92_SACSH|nr:FAD-binding protein [Saccharolobus shibatae]MCH4815797.1 FAD-binding protein [Saccharolobus shibatae]QXJ28955.1 redox protein [Saccharolobus shibatae B12]
MRYDLVIIGSGAAGMSAAVTAAEYARLNNKNISIVVLEKTGDEIWGGNSRYTTANMRFIDEEHFDPNLEETFEKFSKGKANMDHVKLIINNAVDTIKWLKSLGVQFENRTGRWTGYGLPRIGPLGGGLAVISALRKHAESMGVQILFNTTAWKLSLDDEGRINGVWVRDERGRSFKIEAKAIVLACGGFEGNYEMLQRYIGRDAINLVMDNPATPIHQGECINMALEVGAKTSGDFGNWHGSVQDIRSKAYRPRVDLYFFGILVNKDGKRFMDESGVGDIHDSFEVVGRRIFEQRDHMAFIILDNKVTSIPNYKSLINTDLPPITANSLEELGETLSREWGLNKDNFLRTVKEYNNAVQPGRFDPNILDGKCTKGIEPPKSNWALTIDEPPFMAYPVTATVQFTFGGLATDTNARVLDTNDKPILGLYAAGEIVGLYYYRYPGATSFLRALIFGRVAGINAVDYVTEEKSS